MDYEKKYNEALEDMRVIYPNLKGDAKLAVEHAFPELREGEDERIRKWLVDYFGSIKEVVWIHRDITCEQIIGWLEKQKEKPKNAISIPADCATNAKCPYKIHGDEDFIGDIKDTPAYHFGFDEGAKWQKEQMLKDAVDATLCDLSLGNHTEKVLAFGDRFPNGAKVRIIIVKEDEK